jgi:hypothetical protein
MDTPLSSRIHSALGEGVSNEEGVREGTYLVRWLGGPAASAAASSCARFAAVFLNDVSWEVTWQVW